MKPTRRLAFLGLCVLLLAAAGALHWLTKSSPVPIASAPAVHPPPSRQVASAPTTASVEPVAPPAVPDAPAVNPNFPRQDLRWQQPVQEPSFARFKDWTGRYLRAESPGARAALEAEGLQLARLRRAELANLIQTDPERALALAVPVGVRRALPRSITDLLEERVSGNGQLGVLGVLPEPGQEQDVPPVVRTVTLGERYYEAFVYGRRLEVLRTLNQLPLNGIAVGRRLAVNENPVRVLEPEEAADLKNVNAEPLCVISGQPSTINQNEIAADVGGEAVFLCSHAHLVQLNHQLIAAEGLSGPAADGEGGPAASAYTEGRKRILLIRVDFPDLQGAPFTDSAGLTLLTNLNNYFTDASYSKMTVYPPGAGSDLTATFRMANSAAYYGTNNSYEPLRAEARTAADAAGYNRANYDFHVICIGAVPGFSWGGLGYVGGTGAWIRNTSSTGTTAHELGHNLGLNHANFWDTAGQSTIGDGASVEYGDNYDTMGSGGSSRPYNARYRAYLNWLATNEVTTFTTNGVYRIGAYDVTNSTGIRAVRIVRNSGTSSTNNYWIEFRQKSSATKWQLNGAGLRWAGNGNQRSFLLDTTPGSINGKDDSPILIGRTFSDAVFGIHITTLRKTGTVPDALEVMVIRGVFPSNLAPTLTVTAPVTNANANGVLNFSAATTDPNGDALAYAWDFGDGDFSTNNSPNVSHSWTTAGDYVVRCIVSDMKGGNAGDSTLVRIGAPTTYRIAGRIATAGGTPVFGVRVYVSSSRVAYTDSDGTYVLTGLPAGSYTVNANLERYSFTHPAFVNPVSVGPNVINRDFVAGAAGGENTIALVPSGAEWKYLDNGSNQGTNWIAFDFNDSTWDSGPAQLGYGDGDEATEVSYGPNANGKYITTYFRHTFVVANPTDLATLTLGLLHDDGGIVYLNGREVFRSNMPQGPIAFNRVASSTIDAANESTFFETDLNPVFLMTGTNVLAVEIHQANATSSDISFDLFLNALSLTNLPRGVYLTSPANNANVVGPTNVFLSANASGGSVALITKVEFFEGENKLGEATAPPYTLTWSNAPVGLYTLTAVATDTGGILLTSTPVNLTVSMVLSARGSIWKYLDDGSNAGTAWIARGYNDSAWRTGRARLGYGGDGEITQVRSNRTDGTRIITTYFRRWFNVPAGLAMTNLTFSLLRDDGAVVYVNGLEAFRSNIPAAAVNYLTPAAATVSNADEQMFFENSVTMTNVVAGTNVIAVEVHQINNTSSDIGFDLELLGSGSLISTPVVLAAEHRSGGLKLSWPIALTGYNLYSKPDLAGTNWTPASQTISETNGYKFIMITPTNGTEFFMLRKP